MSSASFTLTEERFLCGICLQVFTDPVTLPCGHNFCQKCVIRHWESSPRCHCPSCEFPFRKRLDLRVNTFISEMAAQFRESAGRSSSYRGDVAKPGDVAEPEDVACDVCTDAKGKAVKSCLACLASYCDAHLQPHLTAAALKRHQLTDPVRNLERGMCAVHGKPLELFCNTDQVCVCTLCPVSDHESHEVVPLKEQFEKKKAELRKTEAEIHRMILERRLKILEIKHTAKLGREAADRELAAGVQVFAALIRSLERTRAELARTIEAAQNATEQQAEGFVCQLDREIFDLIRKRGEVEQLSRCKDCLHFLQSVASLNAPAPATDWREVTVEPPSLEGTARTAVDRLEETLGQEMRKLLLEAELIRVQMFAVDVTLDPDTAHRALVLSDDCKRVHHSVVKKNLSESPKRFNPSCCILGKQSFSSGRFYFEAEVKEKTRWTLGVAMASIKRHGIIPLCPDNGHWTIWLKNGGEFAALVGAPLPLSVGSKPQKVGVFVDYDEGVVSFYDVDAAALIYSFTGCSFAERLHPFFSPGLCDDGVNSAPLVISGVVPKDLLKR